MHEYSIINHPREKIIFFIALISIFLAHFLTDYVYPYLQQYFDIKVSFVISGASVFGLIYLLFNQLLWKSTIFIKLLSFPNLNGSWECKGHSRNIETNEEFTWQSTVNISQTWDKILISQQTASSTSQSISNVGCIKHFPKLGYQVSYHYQNTPNEMQRDLLEHDGLCTLLFEENLQKAKGNYFNNGKTRKTVGVMELEKVDK